MSLPKNGQTLIQETIDCLKNCVKLIDKVN